MKSMHDGAKSFLFHCEFERKLSSKTIKAYKIDLNQFTEFLAGKYHTFLFALVDKDVLRNYLEVISKRVKAKTVKRKIASLKSFFNFLEFEERIDVNPFRKWKLKIKEPFRLPISLSRSEAKSIFSTLYKSQSTFNSGDFRFKCLTRDIAAIELLFATGIRVSELCSLKKSDVDLYEKRIVVCGKGNMERIIYLGSNSVVKALREYKKVYKRELENTEYFFINRDGKAFSTQSVRLVLKKHCKEAKLSKNITPHTFRHTFATFLIEEGVDIKFIQHFLGHKSILTTQIYTHVNSRKQEEILKDKIPRIRLLKY